MYCNINNNTNGGFNMFPFIKQRTFPWFKLTFDSLLVLFYIIVHLITYICSIKKENKLVYDLLFKKRKKKNGNSARTFGDKKNRSMTLSCFSQSTSSL